VLSGVDIDAGRHYLLDPAQHIIGQLDIGGGHLGLQVPHRPRTDDYCGHPLCG
jgi:hypothetical protein